MRDIHHECCQASRITFQLTSWLATCSQTADKPRRSPFGSPCSCAALNTCIAASQKGIPTRALQSAYCQASRITFQLTSWLAANTQTADKPRRSPFGSPCGFSALNTRIKAGDKNIPIRALQHACCQAHQICQARRITLQLTSWHAASDC
jgi:hypothetical protein